jgi:hypothetical protein
MRRTVVNFVPQIEYHAGATGGAECPMYVTAATDYRPTQVWLDTSELPSSFAGVVDRPVVEATEGAIVQWLEVHDAGHQGHYVDWQQLMENEQSPAPVDRADAELPPVIRAASLLPAPSELVPGTVQQ